MAETSRCRRITASPRAVWDVLADFGDLAAWADGADHSVILRHGPGGPDALAGTVRRVQVGRSALVETVTVAEPPTTLAYDITGLPARLGRLSNRWTLRAAGGATDVTVTSVSDGGSGVLGPVLGFVVTRVMARQSTSMLTGLAHRLEDHRD